MDSEKKQKIKKNKNTKHIACITRFFITIAFLLTFVILSFMMFFKGMVRMVSGALLIFHFKLLTLNICGKPEEKVKRTYQN